MHPQGLTTGHLITCKALKLESPIPIESESDAGSDAEVDDELNCSEDGDGSEA